MKSELNILHINVWDGQCVDTWPVQLVHYEDWIFFTKSYKQKHKDHSWQQTNKSKSNSCNLFYDWSPTSAPGFGCQVHGHYQSVFHFTSLHGLSILAVIVIAIISLCMQHEHVTKKVSECLNATCLTTVLLVWETTTYWNAMCTVPPSM